MSTPPEVIAARKLNQAKYALEDFDDAVSDLYRVALMLGALALALGLSLAFAADNAGHLMFCLVGIIGMLLARRYDFLPWSNLVVLSAAFCGLLLVEMTMLGLPDLLLPFLNANEWRGVPVFLNHLTPFVYWIAKLVASIYIFRLWFLRKKVYEQPEELLRKVAKDRVL